MRRWCCSNMSPVWLEAEPISQSAGWQMHNVVIVLWLSVSMLPSAFCTRITMSAKNISPKIFHEIILNRSGDSVLAHSLGMFEPTFPSLTFPRTLSWLVLLKLTYQGQGTNFLTNGIACLLETAHVMPVAVDRDGSIKNSHCSHITGPCC